MKYINNLFLAILISSGLYAQTISYTYDLAGNRTSRTVVYLSRDDGKKVGEVNAPESSALKNEEDGGFAEQTMGEMQVKVYPNPTKGKLLVEIDGSKGANSVAVYDMSGKQVYRKSNFGSSGTIDLSGQVTGVYIIKVVAGDRCTEWEVLKE